MNKLIYWSAMICLLAMAQLGASQPAGDAQVVNLMVDYYMPASADDKMIEDATNNLFHIMDELGNRNLDVTLFLTEDTSKQARGFATQQGLRSNVELAMSGNRSGEKLGAKSLGEQKAILESSKKHTELCNVCDVNVITARGFMPQSFDQNQDTYKVIDDLGIDYDAGFKAGILFAPGHENDVWPYQVENHKFWAVPVSTYTFSGEKVAFDDREVKDKGISGSQWKDLLIGKFDEASGKNEPVVVSLSSSVSGSGDYLGALKEFLDYAVSKNAKFVKTSYLVNMTRAGDNPISPSADSESNLISDCPTCDSTKNSNMSFTGKVIGNLTLNDTT